MADENPPPLEDQPVTDDAGVLLGTWKAFQVIRALRWQPAASPVPRGPVLPQRHPGRGTWRPGAGVIMTWTPEETGADAGS